MGDIPVRANLAWWTVPRLLSRLSAVALLPVYTRVLSPAEMGVALACLAVIGIVTLVVAPGFEAAYFYSAYRAGSEEETRWNGIGTVVRIHYSLLGVALIFLAVFGDQIAGALLPGIPPWPYYYVVLAIVAVASLTAPYQVVWRTRRRADVLAYIQCVQAVVAVGVTLLLLLGFRLGAVSILLGELAGSLVLLPIAVVGVAPRLFEPWQSEVMTAVLPMFLAGFPRSLWAWALTGLDRILLNRFSGQAETGIYGVAYQIGSVIAAALIILNKELGPMIASLVHRPGGQETIRRLVRETWLGAVVLGSLIAVLSRLLVDVVIGPRYVMSAPLVPLVLLIGVLQTPTAFLIHVAVAQGRAGSIAAASVTGIIVCVAANFTLIPLFAGQGAAWSGILSYAVSLGVLASRPWNFLGRAWRLVPGLAGFAVASLVGVYLGRTPAALAVAALLAIGLIYRGRRYWEFLGTIRS